MSLGYLETQIKFSNSCLMGDVSFHHHQRKAVTVMSVCVCGICICSYMCYLLSFKSLFLGEGDLELFLCALD